MCKYLLGSGCFHITYIVHCWYNLYSVNLEIVIIITGVIFNEVYFCASAHACIVVRAIAFMAYHSMCWAVFFTSWVIIAAVIAFAALMSSLVSRPLALSPRLSFSLMSCTLALTLLSFSPMCIWHAVVPDSGSRVLRTCSVTTCSVTLALTMPHGMHIFGVIMVMAIECFALLF